MLLASLSPVGTALDAVVGFSLSLGIFLVMIAGVAMLFRTFLGWSPGDPGEARPGTAVAAERDAATALGTAEARGMTDMFHAWIVWAFEAPTASDDNTDPLVVRARLDSPADPRWDTRELVAHGRMLWAMRSSAHRQGEGERLDAQAAQIAAWLTDRRPEDFSAENGYTSPKWKYHEDPNVRAAYLKGGGLGVDMILDAITAERQRERARRAADEAAASLAAERTAAIRAMRETHQATDSRDAKAEWERQAKELEQ